MNKREQEIIYSPTSPWDDNNNDIWLASTLKLYRNVSKYHFSGKLNPSQRKQVLSLLEHEIMLLSHLNQASFFHAEDLSPTQKEFFFEHFLPTEGFHHAHTGEGFVVDSSGHFFGVVNVRDHLQLQVTETQGELENAWMHLTNVEMELGKSVQFSFSPKFGFLTADPWHCGTAFVVRTFLHLPALIDSETFWDVLEAHNKDSAVVATSFRGDTEELIGDIVTLYNQHTIGVTEGDIISNLRTATTKLIVAEKGLRAKYKNECPDNIRDTISRAYGLLKHSYQLEIIEAWEALSACKLGIDIGLISGINHLTLNRLWFDSRRAHLLKDCEEKVSAEDVSVKRAQYIHDNFKNAVLVETP